MLYPLPEPVKAAAKALSDGGFSAYLVGGCLRDALMGRELCVADIAEMIGATQSAVSHQLRTLKQARLVKFQRDGKNIIYSLSDDHVFTMLAQGMTHICE